MFSILRGAALAAALSFLTTTSNAQNGLWREVYRDVFGFGVESLLTDPNYPDNPASAGPILDFEAASDGDFYGQRVSGYITAPLDGAYTFWIASDDQSHLYLSTDQNPDNKELIAEVPGWTSPRVWNLFAEQQSRSITLQAGRRYYIEALMVEGSGDDHLAVRWQLPNGTIEEPIPGNRLLAELVGPSITRHPGAVSVEERQSASFSITLGNRGPVAIQWFRGTQRLENETNAVLVIPAVSMADNGARFRAEVKNDFGAGFSNEGVLTVTPDIVPPAIAGVVTGADPTLITLVFSEPVSRSSATATANYDIPGLTIQNASLDPSGRSVILRTSPMTPGAAYELFVNDIFDTAAEPNIIEFDTRAEFIFEFKPIAPELAYGRSEPLGPSSRRTPLVISEIMYNPPPRSDARNLEFIELYNAGDITENLDGYSLRGDFEYTFPAGTFISPKTYLVLAPNPSDIKIIYGIDRVLGGSTSTNALGDNGSLRLHNRHGALLLEVDWQSAGQWPAAADGAGHSLVLARPSYGEDDPQAWRASASLRGSPGRPEPVLTNPYSTLVINEFLANTDDPSAPDFIELYNYGTTELDLTGLTLTDSLSTNRFKMPLGTRIAPLGFLSFSESQLSFRLSGTGDRIILRTPQGIVIDALRFDAQLNGVSTGRFPDGSPRWRRLATLTPGEPNSLPAPAQLVINEIMYNPPVGSDGEYIELHNPGAQAINLEGWRLDGGISYTLPAVIIPPNGYLVVANNLNYLRTNYPHLTAANSIGNYNGSLSNGGEQIVLTRPILDIQTDANNVLVTNIVHVVVNQVAFETGGRWPKWTDGGGSSLELINPRADNSVPQNWADSIETNKSQWVTIERRGILSHGATNFASTSTSRSLHVLMMGAGEVLIDDVQVFRDGSTNLVANSTFEQGKADWIAQGTHEQSDLAPGQGATGNNAYRVRAVDRGDTASNRIRTRLSQGLTNGMIATIRAKAKWVRGDNEILFRLHGNYLEAEAAVAVPRNLGTPGQANTRLIPNSGPVITSVTHSPVLPAPGQSVTVIADITDPDRIAGVTVRYRIDPSSNVVTVPMRYNGAGFYSAVLPGQPANTNIAFSIEASDTAGARTTFPNDAPNREAIVPFGQTQRAGSFATYRLYLTRKNIDRWAARDRSSNVGLDATFIYNNSRVIYNAETLWSGSPFHWNGYVHPLGTANTRNSANYEVNLPPDDRFLGETDMVLNLPSNLGSDNTGVREQTAFWLAYELGQAANHRRYHHLVINGDDRGRGEIYEDSQQPNRDFVRQWFPEDSEGELFKIEDWFEFSDNFSRFNNDAELAALWTTNLVTNQRELKKERYRWWFRKRAVQDSSHDYSELLHLVEAAATVNAKEFEAELAKLIDIDQWMGAIAFRHIVGDWDSFGYSRGKNNYAYKPENGKWSLLHWDIAFAFGLGDGPNQDLFDTTHFDGSQDTVTQRMFSIPAFRRAYLRTLYEAANGPMSPARINGIIDTRQKALQDNGLLVEDTTAMKNWIQNRRNYILSQLGGVSAGFTITSNGGQNYSTNRNTLILTGSAPVQVKTIRINGVDFPVIWTGVSSWETRVALARGVNTLVVEGYDSQGRLVSGATDTISITETGTLDRDVDRVVISEIHFDPDSPDTEFVELHNTSRTTAFDLGGHRFNGIDFLFPPGSVIAPGGFLVVARNSLAFGDRFGHTIPVVGEFAGSLDNGGETITVVSPDGTRAISSVTFDSIAPWPTTASDTDGSLQLIDPAQDETRAGNWAAQAGVATPNATNSVRAIFAAFPQLWLNEIQALNQSGPADSAGDRDPWVEVYNSSTNQTLSLTGLFLTDDLANLQKWAFPANALLPPGGRALVWLDGETSESTSTEWHAGFRLNSASGVIALSGAQNNQTVVFDYLRFGTAVPDRSFGAFPEGQAQRRLGFFYVTPGAANNPESAPAPVFINEWMASNESTILDPDDSDPDDWIELYNAGTESVDLAGYGLTDDPLRPRQYTFPQGSIVPAKGFLFIWADNERATNGQLHANFRLANEGEILILSAPNGTVIDTVDFRNQAQAVDVSQGRSSDGGTPIRFFTEPTPGFSNSGEMPLQIVAAKRNNQMVLTWASTSGQTYTIESATSLTNPVWSLAGTVTATAATAEFSEAIAAGNRYYRIRQP